MKYLITVMLLTLSLNTFAETTYYSDGSFSQSNGNTTWYSDNTSSQS